jgi:hypothetical protein
MFQAGVDDILSTANIYPFHFLTGCPVRHHSRAVKYHIRAFNSGINRRGVGNISVAKLNTD